MKVVHNRFLDTDDADKWIQRAKGEGFKLKAISHSQLPSLKAK